MPSGAAAVVLRSCDECQRARERERGGGIGGDCSVGGADSGQEHFLRGRGIWTAQARMCHANCVGTDPVRSRRTSDAPFPVRHETSRLEHFRRTRVTSIQHSTHIHQQMCQPWPPHVSRSFCRHTPEPPPRLTSRPEPECFALSTVRAAPNTGTRSCDRLYSPGLCLGQRKDGTWCTRCPAVSNH